MVDSSSADLLSEFDIKRKKWRTWPFALGAFVILLFMFPEGTPSWARISFLIVAALSTYAAYTYDAIKKSVVLFYNLEEEFEKAYQKLLDEFSSFSTANKIWHIEAKADVLDRKRNAGASQAINRKQVKLEIKDPPYTKTNIKVPCIPVGKQELFLFPDRILVFENNKVGAVSYGDLNIEIAQTRFIEDDKVPFDAQVVDRTWKYVNKSGGPDRRFNDNREIPICLYEDVHLKSKNGLNERIQISKCGLSQKFGEALVSLSKTILME
jgi:hypothetical protein